MLRTLLLVVLSASYSAAVNVSVCRDATYELAIDASLLCAGSGSSPAGSRCPKAGDVAVADCHSYLPSYAGEKCVAPEDAVCQLVHEDTWGCVLPSVGCESLVKPKCPTWTYDGHETVDLNGPGFFDGSHNYDESWFVQTTTLRDLYNCGEIPTPEPSTPAPTPEPTYAPDDSVTPAPSYAPDDSVTPAPSYAPDTPVTPAPSSAPEAWSTDESPFSTSRDGDEENREGNGTVQNRAPAESSTVSLSSVDKAKSGSLGVGTIVGVAAAALAVAGIAVAAAFLQARQNADLLTDTRERRASIDYEMALTPVNGSTSPRVITSPRM
ncbi:hypothetical protein PsorP6_006087 [Peronosclerospora sorghi]|uniref:Uncharacterized protein n=1 Tax=Peronosclerospora sorghi TaxID=230839 RepID=A0ACC0W311_9STRA|nr:hypothetical protein PsorP6_006087 [Peronosclerospora sorghi]